MFMELDIKIRKEPGRAYYHERRIDGILPQQSGELLERLLGEVVRNDEGKTSHIFSAFVAV